MMVLPDVLDQGLKVVFCGTAVGARSAQVGAYYAGSGNQFWNILYRTGLTARKLEPHEFRTLPNYGIGLTDLVKSRSGADTDVSSSQFDVVGFRSKIERFAPKAIAFNGKRAAKEFYRRESVDYGRQTERIGPTVIFILPSTSGAARGYWDESQWKKLADFVLNGGSTDPPVILSKTETLMPVANNMNEQRTLHEAMGRVLADCPGQTATFKHVAAEVSKRGLYSQKAGSAAPPSQIRLRAKNYPNLFEVLPPDKVRLR